MIVLENTFHLKNGILFYVFKNKEFLTFSCFYLFFYDHFKK